MERKKIIQKIIFIYSAILVASANLWARQDIYGLFQERNTILTGGFQQICTLEAPQAVSSLRVPLLARHFKLSVPAERL